jgi:hypothetical protein
VAGLRLVSDNSKVTTEVRTFQTTTADLLHLSEWLAANDCTHVVMDVTGVYYVLPSKLMISAGVFVRAATHTTKQPWKARASSVAKISPR